MLKAFPDPGAILHVLVTTASQDVDFHCILLLRRLLLYLMTSYLS